MPRLTCQEVRRVLLQGNHARNNTAPRLSGLTCTHSTRRTFTPTILVKKLKSVVNESKEYGDSAPTPPL